MDAFGFGVPTYGVLLFACLCLLTYEVVCLHLSPYLFICVLYGYFGFLQFGGFEFFVCVCTVCVLIPFVEYWFLLFVWDCLFAGYMIVRCLFLWLDFEVGVMLFVWF